MKFFTCLDWTKKKAFETLYNDIKVSAFQCTGFEIFDKAANYEAALADFFSSNLLYKSSINWHY